MGPLPRLPGKAEAKLPEDERSAAFTCSVQVILWRSGYGHTRSASRLRDCTVGTICTWSCLHADRPISLCSTCSHPTRSLRWNYISVIRFKRPISPLAAVDLSVTRCTPPSLTSAESDRCSRVADLDWITLIGQQRLAQPEFSRALQKLRHISPEVLHATQHSRSTVR